jgi:hypothetical protein
MKYSLRSLMIVVTLVCVLLGCWQGRVAYLRRWAVFHEAECKRYENLRLTANSPEEIGVLNEKSTTHSVLADRCRAAVDRPWTIVNETVFK